MRTAGERSGSHLDRLNWLHFKSALTVSDHLALRFHLGANNSVGFARSFRQGQCGQQIDKLTQPLKRGRSLLALGCPVQQYCFSRTELPESAQNLLRSLLADVNADVC